jgi:hypothetical protein
VNRVASQTQKTEGSNSLEFNLARLPFSQPHKLKLEL